MNVIVDEDKCVGSGQCVTSTNSSSESGLAVRLRPRGR